MYKISKYQRSKTLLILVVFNCILLLGGCTSEEKLEAVLNSYSGYNKSQLFNIWGHPNNVIDDSSGKIYKYGFLKSYYIPGSTSTSASTNSYFGTSSASASSTSGYNVTENCTVSFVSNHSGVITTWQYNGNSCKKYAKKKFINPQYILDIRESQSIIYGFNYKHSKKGVKIKKIDSDSKAYAMGLRRGDLITSINNKSIQGLPIQFADDLFSKSSNFNLDIIRKKEPVTLSISKTTVARLSLYDKSVQKFLGY